MWEWLGVQAQNASPFVAVFCLMMLGIAGTIINKLWKRHITDHEALLTISNSSIQANNAVAMAIERSTATTILAIERTAKGRR